MKNRPLISIQLLLLFVAGIENAGACSAYLISNSKLTDILNSNIGNAPLYNALAQGQTGDKCTILLSAELKLLQLTVPVTGCASPTYSTHKVGLNNLKLMVNTKGIDLPSAEVDVSGEIVKHCGTLKPITGVSTSSVGVYLYFK